MPKRLAIVIAGAVSLGSYEAGVLYEIIDAVGQHNGCADDEQKILIDVLAGASAGGMTAAIAAQKLLFEAQALHGEYNNALYNPWVAEVTLEGLMKMQAKDKPSNSILSSEYIVEISRRYLMPRYGSHPPLPQDRHPACADQIRLGLAMANLNGVDYAIPMAKPGGTNFDYTRYQDRLTVLIDPTQANCDSAGFWDALRNAAVSSGAFPLAFRVVEVIRRASDYTNPHLVSLIQHCQPFAYVDGGTFQNEPLGLAKKLVDEADKHLKTDNRFYLFVSPHAKKSSANSDFNAGNANLWETTWHLLEAIYGQAGFQDWFAAELVNEQVEQFDQAANQLHGLLSGPNGAAHEPTLKALHAKVLPTLFTAHMTSAPGKPQPETQADAQARLREQFQTEYDALPAPLNDAWIDSVLIMEKVAALGPKDKMEIYGITADRSELASTELMSFSGFFDRRYRDHDYDVGRKKAQEFLKSKTALGPIKYKAKPMRKIDDTLDGLTLERMDRDVRLKVRDRLRDRAQEFLEEAGMSGSLKAYIERRAVDLAFIRPRLNKLLMLS